MPKTPKERSMNSFEYEICMPVSLAFAAYGPLFLVNTMPGTSGLLAVARTLDSMNAMSIHKPSIAIDGKVAAILNMKKDCAPEWEIVSLTNSRPIRCQESTPSTISKS